ncbi:MULTISPECIES: MarR family winged helix-turn-helix transcriptional regulator [Paenibacillus]|uniref:MarR family winged helix-turn-helix transcriptional regulator n=1 Tax=Paenibacillus TaxID=44249 RepID=UPI002FE1C0FD
MDKTELFQQFVAFTTAVHEVKHEMTQGLKPEGITPVQYNILEYIAVSQPVTLSQICDCHHISMPNASREIRKLQEKQLCEKVSAKGDRRVQLIRLTEAGQRLIDGVFRQIEARFLERIGGLPESDLRDIGRALRLLHAKVFS